jgi:hypothetical protein
MKETRNLWPLGIIVTLVLFASGTVGLIVMACSQKTELVSSNYYEQEIRYQTRIDSLGRAQQLGTRASVTYDAASRHITISLPAEQARRAAGQIQLYRPSAAGLDQELKLEPGPDGVQTLEAKDLLPGPWKVRVSWTVEGQEYLIDQKIVITAKPAL